VKFTDVWPTGSVTQPWLPKYLAVRVTQTLFCDGHHITNAVLARPHVPFTPITISSTADAIRRVGIPAGQVYTSNFNRAFETTVLAGFKEIEKTTDLTEGGLVVSPDENSRRAAALRKMLAQMPEKGKNTFLITHKPNIIDALGKDWFDVKEGEASIFKPKDGEYRLVARVQMEDWPKLVAVK
jgi:hypothetical protein